MLRISEPSELIASELHEEIVNITVERMMIRMKRGDDYKLAAVDKWNIQVLQDAGYLRRDIEREIAAKTQLQMQEIREAMEDAGVKSIAYDDAIYRAAGLSPMPIMHAPYFQRLMQRGYEATIGEWYNFTRTTADAAQQLFIRSCDKAYNLIASGTMSYSQAVMAAINEAVTDGVMVVYPSGHRDTIETATMRAVRTGIAQATGNVQLERMREVGHDLVITTSHLGARPSHYEWQGKIFHVDWQTFDIYKYHDKNASPPVPKTRHPVYPDFVTSTRYGFVDGLKGANCRHDLSPYVPGMENSVERYDSEENKKAFELSQDQRTMERRIRDTKRQTMALKTALDNAPDDETRVELDRAHQKKAALLKRQNEEYNAFCEENGLKRQADRITIAKWDRQQAAKARGAAKRWENEKTAKTSGKALQSGASGGIIDSDDTTSSNNETELFPVSLSLDRLDELHAWEDEYYRSNANVQFTRADNPNIFEYSSGSYEAINAVERGGESYDAALRHYGSLDGYKGISDGVSAELSKFKLNSDIMVKRVVRNVDYITGATSSVEDMKACIGGIYTEKGFTSATIAQDVASPFGGKSENATILDIIVPKETRGAYIYKISGHPAEFEFLIDKNTTYKILDAGERPNLVNSYNPKKHCFEDKEVIERYMILEVISQ